MVSLCSCVRLSVQPRWGVTLGVTPRGIFLAATDHVGHGQVPLESREWAGRQRSAFAVELDVGSRTIAVGDAVP
jgi:hypothetical protein